jgi:rubrerythrin
MGVVVFQPSISTDSDAMSTSRELIDGLEQAIEMERSAMQIYQSGRREADESVALRLQQIEQGHLTQMQRMNAERERIQDAEGEGMLGDALESIGKAFTGLVAGIPLTMIEDSTVPTVATLTRLEEDLLGLYHSMLLIASPQSRVVLENAITACREHITELEQIDSI